MGAEGASVENGPEKKENVVAENVAEDVLDVNTSESEDLRETLLRTAVEGKTSINSFEPHDTTAGRSCLLTSKKLQG